MSNKSLSLIFSNCFAKIGHGPFPPPLVKIVHMAQFKSRSSKFETYIGDLLRTFIFMLQYLIAQFGLLLNLEIMHGTSVDCCHPNAEVLPSAKHFLIHNFKITPMCVGAFRILEIVYSSLTNFTLAHLGCYKSTHLDLYNKTF